MTLLRTLRIGPKPNLAVDVCGSGEALVFLHGMGGNRSNWVSQLDAFGGSHLAIAFDFRGYGDSDDIDGEHEFGDFIEDLTRVLDGLDIERAHLVGLSMGGLVAQGFYAAHPERVLSLGLAATRPGSAPVFPGERKGDFVNRRLAPLENGGGIETVADRVTPTLAGSNPTPEFLAEARASLLKLRVPNYIKVIRSRVAIEPFLDLADIDVPTLVFAGTHDQVAPLAQMQEIADEIPDSQLEVIEGAGHLMNIERPDVFDAALRRFFAGITANPARDLEGNAGVANEKTA